MVEILHGDDLVALQDATEMLGVTPDELWGIVREGLLTPVEGQEEDCFRGCELVALRKLAE